MSRGLPTLFIVGRGKPMTLMQAFKVWWSYSWRASLLVIPLGLIMMVVSVIELVSGLGTGSLSASDLANLNVSHLNVDSMAHLLSGGLTLWVLSIVLTAVIQVFAMRWALNSRWSDFRLKAVPPDADLGAEPRTGTPGPAARV
jgi:hypothetical protein